jgi:DNA-binding NarL/FixJ family response regulator
VATAATTLERLIPELERDRLRVELLSSYLDLGLLMANSDRARSIAMLSKAATLAEEIGAVTHGRLARQELRRLGVRAWRRGAIGAPESDRDDALRRLTDREREVARLVARGRSNREIADALLISPKTVERHVTNLLTKLDLRNRVELASAMGTAVVRGSPDESGAPSP